MLRVVRDIAEQTDKVFFTAHAKKRMRERAITATQVFACLRHGSISEPAHLDIGSCWRCTLVHRHAGDVVHVAVAIQKDQQDGAWIAVVTVF